MLIRLATLDDLPQLAAIDLSAAETFRGSSQPLIADDAETPNDEYPRFIANQLVWIAEIDGEAVGFAAAELFPDAMHLWELSVRFDRQRRGVGRQLIARTAAAAAERACSAVTLTTFKDIPWNAPFYTRLGFEVVGPDAPQPRRAELEARETRLGLDVAARCFMRLALPARAAAAKTDP